MGFVEIGGEMPYRLSVAFLSHFGDRFMRKLSVFSFAAALVAVSFVGPVSAEPQWGWECDGSKSISVEHETLVQSVAETDGPQSTKPAD